MPEIISLEDNVALTLSFDILSIDIHNRDLNPDENNILGYQKTLNSDGYLSLGTNTTSFTTFNVNHSYYDIIINLNISESKYFSLLELYNEYITTKRDEYKDAYELSDVIPLTGSVFTHRVPSESITLVDNKIKDYYSQTFEEYQFVLTEFAPPSEVMAFSNGENYITTQITGVAFR